MSEEPEGTTAPTAEAPKGRPTPKQKKPGAKTKSHNTDISKGVVVLPVTIGGRKLQMRASKYLMGVVAEAADDAQLDDESLDETLDMETFKKGMHVIHEQIRLFDGTDAKNGTPSSREQVMWMLDNAVIDVEDLAPAFKRLNALVDKGTKRPLG